MGHFRINPQQSFGAFSSLEINPIIFSELQEKSHGFSYKVMFPINRNTLRHVMRWDNTPNMVINETRIVTLLWKRLIETKNSILFHEKTLFHNTGIGGHIFGITKPILMHLRQKGKHNRQSRILSKNRINAAIRA